MFIPPKCIKCGESLSRSSDVNPDLKCIDNHCGTTYQLKEIPNE